MNNSTSQVDNFIKISLNYLKRLNELKPGNYELDKFKKKYQDLKDAYFEEFNQFLKSTNLPLDSECPEFPSELYDILSKYKNGNYENYLVCEEINDLDYLINEGGLDEKNIIDIIDFIQGVIEILKATKMRKIFFFPYDKSGYVIIGPRGVLYKKGKKEPGYFTWKAIVTIEESIFSIERFLLRTYPKTNIISILEIKRLYQERGKNINNLIFQVGSDKQDLLRGHIIDYKDLEKVQIPNFLFFKTLITVYWHLFKESTEKETHSTSALSLKDFFSCCSIPLILSLAGLIVSVASSFLFPYNMILIGFFMVVISIILYFLFSFFYFKNKEKNNEENRS